MKKLVLRFRKNKIFVHFVKRKKIDNRKFSEWLNFNKNNKMNLFKIH